MTFINPAAATVLSWPDEYLSNQTIHHIFGRDLPNVEECCPIHNIMQGNKRFQANEKLFWSRDCSNFSVDFISPPIMENCKLQGIVVIFRDITERKKTAEKLKLAYSEIEQLKNRLLAENSYLQEQVSPTATSVLIQAETGTGKRTDCPGTTQFKPT